MYIGALSKAIARAAKSGETGSELGPLFSGNDREMVITLNEWFASKNFGVASTG